MDPDRRCDRCRHWARMPENATLGICAIYQSATDQGDGGTCLGYRDALHGLERPQIPPDRLRP